jgi:transposase
MWSIPALEVTEVERTELERRVRAKTSTQREAQRARIVLLAADGVPNRQIAQQVVMSEEYVGTWRRRFAEKRFEGLKDMKRSGRPRKYGHDERLRVVAAATAERPEFDSEWSHRLLADYLSDLGISASQVGRILAELDIKPHQVRGWLTRKEDPSFWERAADVCGLYLSPPTNAIVLSVDEKTAISARSPKHPTRPARAGRPALKEFEYRRNGVASIVAALDVHSGQVQAEQITRNDADHFIEFLANIDEKTDAALAVHLILDNGSSHVAKKTKAWLAGHPRFHVHHTPKHASWLNQVELVFSILTRRLLKRGEFSSREDLVAKIMAWIANYDRTAKPFAWTYDGKPLKVA